MLQVADLSGSSNTGISIQLKNQVSVFRDLMRDVDGSSGAVIARRGSLPNHGEHDHLGSIEDSVSKQVVVLQSDSVHLPLEVSAVALCALVVVLERQSENWEITAASVEEGVTGGSQDSQMLKITPCQLRIGFKSESEDSGCFGGSG